MKVKNAMWLNHRLEFSKSVTRIAAKMSIIYLNKPLSILRKLELTLRKGKEIKEA